MNNPCNGPLQSYMMRNLKFSCAKSISVKCLLYCQCEQQSLFVWCIVCFCLVQDFLVCSIIGSHML